jgi:anhydro-N-acetylmuramic acid kinase
LSDKIVAAGESGFCDGIEWLKLDAELGGIMGRSAALFIRHAEARGFRVDLVAMHGQTVRHLPEERHRSLTYQIGDASRVAAITGRPVISDFRRSDIAAGGEGAPLSPILHEALFRHGRKWRAIVNIGGIANATILPPAGAKIRPFAGDCGPGNMMIDMAMKILFDRPYDLNGRVASEGKTNMDVVRQALAHPYFGKKPPKSTGREVFGAAFLESIMEKPSSKASASDIVATVTEITVEGISDFIRKYSSLTEEIYLCGGGAHNRHIAGRLREELPRISIATTRELGCDPDYLEALLWAYLGYCFIAGKRVGAREFTGAPKSYIPGKLSLP